MKVLYIIYIFITYTSYLSHKTYYMAVVRAYSIKIFKISMNKLFNKSSYAENYSLV